MNDEQLNKRIHEIMGIRWYSGYLEDIGYNYDFVHTWRGFGMLWEFMQEHERWEEFIEKHGSYVLIKRREQASCIYSKYINPQMFAKAVEEFFIIEIGEGSDLKDTDTKKGISISGWSDGYKKEQVPIPNTSSWGEEDGFTKEK